MSGVEGPPTVSAVGGRALGSAETAASVARGRAAHHVPRKWARVLRALLDGPRTSRQLEGPPVFDHVAHSTLAELRRRRLEIHTEMISIPGYAGEPARVARYTLAEASRERAEQLLRGEQ